MKTTNWKRPFTALMTATLFLSLVACGSQNESADSEDLVRIQPLSAAEARQLPGMIAMIEVGQDGKVVSSEVREINGATNVNIRSAQDASSVFANARTANEDTSADSYYSPGYCAQNLLPFGNQVTNYGWQNFHNRNCVNFNQLNYGQAWNGYTYSSQRFHSSSQTVNRFPTFGCTSIHCYNYANLAWPTYYRRSTFASTTVQSSQNLNNGFYGYRYPFANAYQLNPNRFIVHYPRPAWNNGGLFNWNNINNLPIHRI